jgi:hypothetical protein
VVYAVQVSTIDTGAWAGYHYQNETKTRKQIVKVTIQFEEKFEVVDVIHADEAWATLREIQRLLRVNEKHDVGDAVTLQRISVEILDAFSVRGDSA